MNMIPVMINSLLDPLAMILILILSVFKGSISKGKGPELQQREMDTCACLPILMHHKNNVIAEKFSTACLLLIIDCYENFRQT